MSPAAAPGEGPSQATPTPSETGWDPPASGAASSQGVPAGQTPLATQPGTAQPGTPAWGGQVPPPPPNEGRAITALVLGIVGCFPLVGVTSIPAIIVAALALKRIKEDPEHFGGHGMAMTALILGIIGVVVGIIALIFLFAVFIPLIEFCEENPDDPQCEGISQSASAGLATIAWSKPAPGGAWFGPGAAWPSPAWLGHGA